MHRVTCGYPSDLVLNPMGVRDSVTLRLISSDERTPPALLTLSLSRANSDSTPDLISAFSPVGAHDSP